MNEGERIAIVSQATLLSQGPHRLKLETLGRVREVAPWPSAGGNWKRIAELLEDPTVIVAGPEPYPGELLHLLPRLKLIARSGVGVEHIDLNASERRGIRVATTPGTNARAVAQHVLALALSAMHRVTELDQRVRRGQWRPDQPEWFREVNSLKIGVLGYGGIGREVARIFIALGATVSAHDPMDLTDAEPRVNMFPSIVALADWCDILTVHVPSSPATRGLVGREVLNRMKAGSVLVNTARGDIVDREALQEFLQSESRFVALDVFDQEPPNPNDPLFASRRSVFSPHIAAFSLEAAQRGTEMILSEIEALALNLANSDITPSKNALAGPSQKREEHDTSGT